MSQTIAWSHATHTLPVDLLKAKELLYDGCALDCTEPVAEPESKGYAAFSLAINGQSVRYRIAKTTPTKVGQFVTFWIRDAAGTIRPFIEADGIAICIVSVRSATNFGQFIFPKSVLIRQGIWTSPIHKGKRALRVYPPWEMELNKQAQLTQAWQLPYFIDLSEGTVCNKTFVQGLFGR